MGWVTRCFSVIVLVIHAGASQHILMTLILKNPALQFLNMETLFLSRLLSSSGLELFFCFLLHWILSVCGVHFILPVASFIHNDDDFVGPIILLNTLHISPEREHNWCVHTNAFSSTTPQTDTPTINMFSSRVWQQLNRWTLYVRLPRSLNRIGVSYVNATHHCRVTHNKYLIPGYTLDESLAAILFQYWTYFNHETSSYIFISWKKDAAKSNQFSSCFFKINLTSI